MMTTSNDLTCEVCQRDLMNIPNLIQQEVIRGCSRYHDLTVESQDFFDDLVEKTLENIFDSQDKTSVTVMKCISNQWTRNYDFIMINHDLIEEVNALYSWFRSADFGTLNFRRKVRREFRDLFTSVQHKMFPNLYNGCRNHQDVKSLFERIECHLLVK